MASKQTLTWEVEAIGKGRVRLEVWTSSASFRIVLPLDLAREMGEDLVNGAKDAT
ncbi:hypothetical protein LCGC14_1570890 [marine sediment metagenome]|uniref:Uncharacterized protein n=1 Tax=marine sediment metagenome TaxID=412755 RepID=A0A0F9J5X5_9ZZZZ